jgi:hypothetical protein
MDLDQDFIIRQDRFWDLLKLKDSRGAVPGINNYSH